MPRKQEAWWLAFQKGEREARSAAKTGKPLKPLRITLTPAQAERMGFQYDQGIALVPVFDLPGARSLFEKKVTEHLPKARDVERCEHAKLKLWADTIAICWACGQKFEVEKL